MSFNDVIGQGEAKELLRRSLLKQRIASAYLFCGPEGVGKTMTAMMYAKAMNCKLHDDDSCGNNETGEKCSSCKKIDHHSHPDISIIFPVPKKVRDEKGRTAFLAEGKLHEYRRSEVISIDDIRDIEEMLFLKPYEARRRVVIVVDAESMTQQAQNAFLKLLEEPPKNTTIILTSSQPENLFSTIRSRCQKVQFKRLSREEMRAYICGEYEVSDDELGLACLLSNGSISKAHSLFDEDVSEERALLKELVVQRAFERLDEIQDKETLERFITFLIPLMRDISIVGAHANILNVDMDEYIRTAHDKYTIEEIRKKIHLLVDNLGGIARNVNPRLIANVVYNSIEEE